MTSLRAITKPPPRPPRANDTHAEPGQTAPTRPVALHARRAPGVETRTANIARRARAQNFTRVCEKRSASSASDIHTTYSICTRHMLVRSCKHALRFGVCAPLMSASAGCRRRRRSFDAHRREAATPAGCKAGHHANARACFPHQPIQDVANKMKNNWIMCTCTCSLQLIRICMCSVYYGWFVSDSEVRQIHKDFDVAGSVAQRTRHNICCYVDAIVSMSTSVLH